MDSDYEDQHVSRFQSSLSLSDANGVQVFARSMPGARLMRGVEEITRYLGEKEGAPGEDASDLPARIGCSSAASLAAGARGSADKCGSGDLATINIFIQSNVESHEVPSLVLGLVRNLPTRPGRAAASLTSLGARPTS